MSLSGPLLFMRGPWVDLDQSFIPYPPVLTYYAAFFAMGWLMNRHPRNSDPAKSSSTSAKMPTMRALGV